MLDFLKHIKIRRLLRNKKVSWKVEDTMEMTRFMSTPTGYKVRCILDDFVVNTAFNVNSNDAYRMGAVDLRSALLCLVDESVLTIHEESEDGGELEH